MSTPTLPTAQTRYCPHCHMPLLEAAGDRPEPLQVMRCPHCRLIVGAGRAIAADKATEHRGASVIANVMAGAAREANGTRIEPERLHDVLRSAAAMLGVRPERMRMLDYNDLVVRGEVDVSVADVLASATSWKAACREAALSRHRDSAA